MDIGSLHLNPFFNTQHSPTGAHAGLTLGFPGARGGMDLERCQPPNQDILIALESADEAGVYDALPFFDAKGGSETERFVTEHEGAGRDILLRPFELNVVTRHFSLATDTWQAGDLQYTLLSPSGHIPDPAHNTRELQRALTPAVWCEVTVDNRTNDRPRTLALGFSRIDPYMGLRHIRMGDGLTGIGEGLHMALITDHPGAWSALGMDWQELLDPAYAENRASGLGGHGVVGMAIPARERTVVRFAYCFHRAGIVTAGLPTRYFYNRWFDSTEAVGRFALEEFDDARERSKAADRRIEESRLNSWQKFTIAHTTRSYLYSTQLLEHDGRPLWVVNEGEFNMINTLDLVPDHSLYEICHHPWTVKNVLDQFAQRYSYVDDLRLHATGETASGGISFAHDMGAAGVFSPEGRSAYERAGLKGCFSHMSTEELLNWTLTAGLYVEASNDIAWLDTNSRMLLQCLESMERRDHPDHGRRTGVPRWDSSRCGSGREITTYDSLDASLGQASGNTYLVCKLWAASAVLASLFEKIGAMSARERAWQQALRAASAVTRSASESGRIPALLEGGSDAVILPVVEGLAYAWFGGAQAALAPDGPFADLLSVLRQHMTRHVLRKEGCLYDDGGWRITSTSNRTFPAKVHVCQFVARHILRLPIRDISLAADRAHALWQLHPERSAWCWTEQVVDGVMSSAKYYPRGVNSNVWLSE